MPSDLRRAQDSGKDVRMIWDLHTIGYGDLTTVHMALLTVAVTVVVVTALMVIFYHLWHPHFVGPSAGL